VNRLVKLGRRQAAGVPRGTYLQVPALTLGVLLLAGLLGSLSSSSVAMSASCNQTGIPYAHVMFGVDHGWDKDLVTINGKCKAKIESFTRHDTFGPLFASLYHLDIPVTRDCHMSISAGMIDCYNYFDDQFHFSRHWTGTNNGLTCPNIRNSSGEPNQDGICDHQMEPTNFL
jgi:hypothetical protein